MDGKPGRSAIEKLQLERLRQLLRELVGRNRFYSDRLKEASVTAQIDSLATFAERMPFTTKMDLVWDREESPPYGSNFTHAPARYTRYCQSSGTTSGPLPWLDTNESWASMLDCWDEVYERSGLRREDVFFFAFSFGPFLGFWTGFEAATRRGHRSIPGGGMSSEARLRTMAANDVTVLCCTPTYAMRLGEVRRSLDDEALAGLQVHTILVAGEPGGCLEEVRSRLESLWPGARVVDHHGMTEVGPVTYEHPDHPMNLLVMESAFFAEVIDRETLQEVGEGETGELVLTNLTRTACPLLRYRTGDLVEKRYFPVNEANGETPLVLGLAGGILGRVDEMVVIRGVNIYPTAVERIIRGFAEVAEYQAVESLKDSMAELEIRVEPHPGLNEDAGAKLVARIEKALSNAFTLRIPVRLAGEGSLPRYEFKAQRWKKQKQDSTATARTNLTAPERGESN